MVAVIGAVAGGIVGAAMGWPEGAVVGQPLVASSPARWPTPSRGFRAAPLLSRRRFRVRRSTEFDKA